MGGFTTCSNAGCGFCRFYDPSPGFLVCPYNGRAFTCPTVENVALDHTNTNLVYLMTCRCGLQYVGSTICKDGIAKRFSKHKAQLHHQGTGTYLHHHIKRCQETPTFSVALLAKCPDDKTTRRVENLFMCQLRTVYPYGLNDCFLGEPLVTATRGFAERNQLNQNTDVWHTMSRYLRKHRVEFQQYLKFPPEFCTERRGTRAPPRAGERWKNVLEETKRAAARGGPPRGLVHLIRQLKKGELLRAEMELAQVNIFTGTVSERHMLLYRTLVHDQLRYRKRCRLWHKGAPRRRQLWAQLLTMLVSRKNAGPAHPARGFTRLQKDLRVTNAKRLNLKRVTLWEPGHDPPKTKEETPLNCCVTYLTKRHELLNLEKVFASVKCKFPPELGRPRVTTRYGDTARGLLLNHAKTLREVDLEKWAEQNTRDGKLLPCRCTGRIPGCQHTFRGCVMVKDLDELECPAVTDLLRKGPSFRLEVHMSDKEIVDGVLREIAEFVAESCKKSPYGAADPDLGAWHSEVIQKVRREANRMTHIRHRWTTKREIEPELDAIATLHEKFVVVPADKAAQNLVVVCKDQYIFRCLEELGYFPGTENSTYKILKGQDPVAVLLPLVGQAFALTGVVVGTPGNPRAPSWYWLPKLHKPVVGARFISPACGSWSTDLAKVLHCALDLVTKDIVRDDLFNQRFRGFRSYTVVPNADPVRDTLDNMRSHSASTVNSYDFAGLYTSLPIEMTIERITALLDKAFARAGGRGFMYIPASRNPRFTRWRAEMTKTAAKEDAELASRSPDMGNQPRTWFTLDQLKQILGLFLRNGFFQVGGLLVHQGIGIFMGSSCSPLVANLLLHSFEAEKLQSYRTENCSNPLEAKRKHKHLYRFLDDILVMNLPHEKFMALDMYPPELKLTLESTEINISTSFLDLSIWTQAGRHHYSMYDKRRGFPFRVTRFMHADTCARRMTKVGVIKSQVLRILRRCQRPEHVRENLRILEEDLQYRGFDRAWLPQVLNRRHRQQWELLRKLSLPAPRRRWAGQRNQQGNTNNNNTTTTGGPRDGS